MRCERQLNMRNLLLRSLALVLLAPGAWAQLRLPTVPLISKPLNALDATADNLQNRTLNALGQARLLQVQVLVRAHPREIDTDTHGNPIVRSEVLALGPTEDSIRRATALGFGVLRDSTMAAIELRLVVLSAPEGMSTRKALKRLRAADPTGTYDFNHIYTPSGDVGPATAQLPSDDDAAPPPVLPTLRAVRVGLLDSGVDVRHPALADARVHQWGCADKPVSAEHGTAVASLMVGHAGNFEGVRPAAELFAADVYCGVPTGGSVDMLVAGLGWLAHERVPVLNVSLVGPANILLERVIAALIVRGFIIVAAVGNDGPAAPPLYPASYPQVVGVTGVDAHRHVLLEAARGPQVMFAAPGADLAAALPGGGYAAVRGTSFAAPIVASLLATELSGPDTAMASSALAALAKAAQPGGKAGRDLTYGFGIVGFDYRIDPSTLIRH
jgi:Subtilase family